MRDDAIADAGIHAGRYDRASPPVNACSRLDMCETCKRGVHAAGRRCNSWHDATARVHILLRSLPFISMRQPSVPDWRPRPESNPRAVCASGNGATHDNRLYHWNHVTGVTSVFGYAGTRRVAQWIARIDHIFRPLIQCTAVVHCAISNSDSANGTPAFQSVYSSTCV